MDAHNDEDFVEGKTFYDLQFISFTDPEEMRSSSSISAIRQHAMKEVGKSRRRRKRPIKLDLVLKSQSISQLEDAQRVVASQESSPTSSWFLGAGPLDPFIKYPIDLGPSERDLVALSKLLS